MSERPTIVKIFPEWVLHPTIRPEEPDNAATSYREFFSVAGNVVIATVDIENIPEQRTGEGN